MSTAAAACKTEKGGGEESRDAHRDTVCADRTPISSRLGEDRDPDFGRPPSLGLAGFTAQSPGFLEHAEGAFDLAAFLVAAVLFPDPLCARWRQGPTMSGASGPVAAFSGT